MFYKCPEPDCLKAYTTKYNLKVHLRTSHMKVNQFRCECDMVFKHKCSLEKHRMKHIEIAI
jgi:hypothetical protein